MHSILFLFLFPLGILTAQVEVKKDLVQVSGVLIAQESYEPVYFANIILKPSNRGTASNIKGFFSVAAPPGETLSISAIGFQSESLIVPDTLSTSGFSFILEMKKDTITLPESIIYPWPKPHEFKKAFLALEIPDDDIARAKKHLEKEKLIALAEGLDMDGGENYDYQVSQRVKSYYHIGQPPPIQIFNVFAWVEFIKAWKRGDFKKKK